MEKCKIYAKGKTKEGYIFGSPQTFCKEECPYNNKLELPWDDDILHICKTGGLIKKVKETVIKS